VRMTSSVQLKNWEIFKKFILQLEISPVISLFTVIIYKIGHIFIKVCRNSTKN
jgi:hypothetical protein